MGWFSRTCEMKDNSPRDLPGAVPILRRGFPDVSVVRPRTKKNAGAVYVVNALVKSGLFKGQSQEFFESTMKLATAANAAQREI